MGEQAGDDAVMPLLPYKKYDGRKNPRNSQYLYTFDDLKPEWRANCRWGWVVGGLGTHNDYRDFSGNYADWPSAYPSNYALPFQGSVAGPAAYRTASADAYIGAGWTTILSDMNGNTDGVTIIDYWMPFALTDDTYFTVMLATSGIYPTGNAFQGTKLRQRVFTAGPTLNYLDSFSPSLGQFHVAVTHWDGSTQRAFLDGFKWGSTTSTTGAFNTSGTVYVMNRGGANTMGRGYWVGSLIYDYPVPEGQIKKLGNRFFDAFKPPSATVYSFPSAAAVSTPGVQIFITK